MHISSVTLRLRSASKSGMPNLTSKRIHSKSDFSVLSVFFCFRSRLSLRLSPPPPPPPPPLPAAGLSTESTSSSSNRFGSTYNGSCTKDGVRRLDHRHQDIRKPFKVRGRQSGWPLFRKHGLPFHPT